MMAATGLVLWITGLSGAGKTTVAGLVRDALVRRGARPVLLDGDVLRHIFAPLAQHGHGRSDRLPLAKSYASLCHELAGQGQIVICATMSMFHEVRAWNRQHIANYVEIYLQVPLAELERRDVKDIYARARAGQLRDVIGVDIPAEEPEAPDLVIENHGATAPGRAARDILDLLDAKGLS